MLLKQRCNLVMAAADVLSDGAAVVVAVGVVGAEPCYSLTHLVQCLTTAAELAHEDSTGDLDCYLQDDFHTMLRTAGRLSYGSPPYVVETSSDAGWGQIAQVTTLGVSRNAAMKTQSMRLTLAVHDARADPEPHGFFGVRYGMQICCCLAAETSPWRMRHAQDAVGLDSTVDSYQFIVSIQLLYF